MTPLTTKMDQRLRGVRSFLFVPGHLERMLHKAAQTEADALVIDLEDAVLESSKQVARQITRQFLEEFSSLDKTLIVRMNSYETGLTSDDLKEVVCARLHGILYPWANQPEAIQRLEAELTEIEKAYGWVHGKCFIIALIETPQAVLRAYDIARSSSRLAGLIFGCEDFLAELEGRHDSSEAALLTPRAQVAMAARAASLIPIDTPYTKVRDLKGLRRFAQTGRDIGMSGMCALTPDQVKVINRVYTPTPHEIKQAEDLLQAAVECENRGRLVCLTNGQFVSPPTIKAARKLLDRARAIRPKSGDEHA